MTRRRRVARQAIELGFAAPVVVAQRMLRMAAAGASPSVRDRREMMQMGSEKVAAFWESWYAMAFESMRIGWRASASPWLWWGVAARGLAPWHRRTVANAARLSRTRRRRRG